MIFYYNDILNINQSIRSKYNTTFDIEEIRPERKKATDLTISIQQFNVYKNNLGDIIIKLDNILNENTTDKIDNINIQIEKLQNDNNLLNNRREYILNETEYMNPQDIIYTNYMRELRTVNSDIHKNITKIAQLEQSKDITKNKLETDINKSLKELLHKMHKTLLEIINYFINNFQPLFNNNQINPKDKNEILNNVNLILNELELVFAILEEKNIQKEYYMNVLSDFTKLERLIQDNFRVVSNAEKPIFA